MLSPKLYKNSHTYDFFIRLLGYERSIDRFLHDLEVGKRSGCRILDAGCGTGLLGLHFLERLPNATLVSTDLEPNFLRAAMTNARRRGICQERMTVGIADISNPHQVTCVDGGLWELEDGSFDLICVGAVLGYAKDTEASVRHLVRLLAPGGCLINLEMNEGIFGRFVSKRYHYDNIRIARMLDVIQEEGCELAGPTMRIHHLPARLTRTAVIARKTVSAV
jgi:malonyl-CoA O-methyltransferase